MASRNNLTLNVKKTVFMCFSKKLKIKVLNKEIKDVNVVSFLVVLDSQLKFDKHINRLSKAVKINLICFKLIRCYITTEAAHLLLHAMIVSRISYCIKAWSQTSDPLIRKIEMLYNWALKIVDKSQINAITVIS